MNIFNFVLLYFCLRVFADFNVLLGAFLGVSEWFWVRFGEPGERFGRPWRGLGGSWWRLEGALGISWGVWGAKPPLEPDFLKFLAIFRSLLGSIFCDWESIEPIVDCTIDSVID